MKLSWWDGETEHDLPYMETTKRSQAWHYTSAAGLIGIVRDNVVWASAPITLNDSSEVHYGLSLLNQAWRSIKAESSQDELAHTRAQQVDRLITPAGEVWASRLYVASASADSDSLNQWQGYSEAMGYAVGLNTKVMFAVTSEHAPMPSVMPPVGWFDVIYERGAQEKAVHDVIQFFLGFPEDRDLPDFMLLSTIAALVARLKHPAFEAEQEIRLMAWLHPSGKELFRPGARGVVPYVKVGRAPDDQPLVHVSDGRGSMPITGVTCAPSNPQDTPPIVEAVERLLADSGIDAPVTPSQIPYRF